MNNRFLIAVSGASLLAVFVNLSIHGLDIFYGNPYLLKNLSKRKKYIPGIICFALIIITLSTLLNIWLNPYLAVSIVLLFTFILFALQTFFMSKKSILHSN